MAVADRLKANEDGYAIPWLSVDLIGKLALTPDLKERRTPWCAMSG